MARIPYPPEVPGADGAGALPAPLNLLRMYAHAPALVGPVAEFGRVLHSCGALPPRLRELAIMAVAARTGCAYEVVQHRPVALDAGLRAEQLDALAAGAAVGEPLFDATEAAVLAATGELLAGRTLGDASLAALRDRLTDRQLVELVTVVGYYAMLAGLLNALDVDIDPVGGRFADLTGRGSAPPAG